MCHVCLSLLYVSCVAAVKCVYLMKAQCSCSCQCLDEINRSRNTERLTQQGGDVQRARHVCCSAQHPSSSSCSSLGFQLQMRCGCGWRPSGQRRAHGCLCCLCAGSLSAVSVRAHRQAGRQTGGACGQSCGHTGICSAAPPMLETTVCRSFFWPLGVAAALLLRSGAPRKLLLHCVANFE